LCVLRLAAFYAIYATRSTDAQWQLAYLPLWLIDFPVSVSYFSLPIPRAEAVIGPIWWFVLPLLVWLIRRRWAKAGAQRP
jgi:hypothetical protein